METPSKILRRSIFSFLQNYQYFTTTAALLAFPFAASILLLQSLVPSRTRIHSLFYAAAGFPSSSLFFSILYTKLSQTIAISVLAFPSTLSSFLFSKASVIHALTNQQCPKKPSFSCFFKLIHTQLCNSLLTLSANATCFSLLFIAFNLADGLGLSSPGLILFLSTAGAVVFSVIVANSFIICNLALILSATQKIGGFTALLWACILIKGRTATALSLALPTNAAMAAVELLFQYRVMRAYHDDAETELFSVALEGLFIAYLYTLLLVLDTIVCYFFFTSCQVDQDGRLRQINPCRSIKIVEDLPWLFASVPTIQVVESYFDTIFTITCLQGKYCWIWKLEDKHNLCVLALKLSTYFLFPFFFFCFLSLCK